jgi:tRNA (guanine37-N1)-methyltransferase
MPPHLSIDILTIFPGMFPGVLGESIVGRAIAQGLVEVTLTDIRDFAADPHRKVDDRPYGGGPGMVFKPEPVVAAVESVLARLEGPGAREGALRKIILTPQGRRLEQPLLRELARAERIVILCGHYEGFDERVQEVLGFEEVSIGDYVLSGGEIPAMVLLDGIVRLVPGALGHPDSAREESFEGGLLDCPHYTRPPEFRGLKVPEVLLSGNHRLVEEWRRQQALERTRARRGDLIDDATGRRAAEEEPEEERSGDRDGGEMVGSAQEAESPFLTAPYSRYSRRVAPFAGDRRD